MMFFSVSLSIDVVYRAKAIEVIVLCQKLKPLPIKELFGHEDHRMMTALVDRMVWCGIPASFRPQAEDYFFAHRQNALIQFKLIFLFARLFFLIASADTVFRQSLCFGRSHCCSRYRLIAFGPTLIPVQLSFHRQCF